MSKFFIIVFFLIFAWATYATYGFINNNARASFCEGQLTLISQLMQKQAQPQLPSTSTK